MPEIQQNRCKIHPNELITNYCAKDGCFLELCATCICSHTEHHIRMNTKPIYQNIKDTFQLTNQRLNCYKNSLTQEKSRIKNLMDRMDQDRRQSHNLIRKAKEDTVKFVQRKFQQIEKQFDEQFEKEKQKTGLHRYQRLDQIYSQLGQRCLDVYSVTQDLNSLKNPSLIKKINNQFLVQGNNFRERVGRQITENENFRIEMVYHSACLRELQNTLRRLISTSYSYPITEKLRASSRTPIKMKQNTYGTFNRSKYEQMGDFLKGQQQKLKIQTNEQSRSKMASSCNFKEIKESWLLNKSPLKPNSQLFSNTYTH